MNLHAEKGNGNQTDSSSSVLESVKDMVQSCIQCGTCTGSCPNSFAMDISPRKLWRMVMLGQKDEIFKSKTFNTLLILLLLHPEMPPWTALNRSNEYP